LTLFGTPCRTCRRRCRRLVPQSISNLGSRRPVLRDLRLEDREREEKALSKASSAKCEPRGSWLGGRLFRVRAARQSLPAAAR